MPYRLSVCGKHEIENFSRESLTHLLSLEDPGTPMETPPWFKGEHFQLLFHDVSSVSEARMLDAIPPSKNDVEEILAMGSRCLQANGRAPVHLLVHCFAGISRSTAAAYALVAQALGPGSEERALKFIRELRPEAYPNLLIAKYADQLLAREGELVRTLGPLRLSYTEMVEEWFKSSLRGGHS